MPDHRGNIDIGSSTLSNSRTSFSIIRITSKSGKADPTTLEKTLPRFVKVPVASKESRHSLILIPSLITPQCGHPTVPFLPIQTDDDGRSEPDESSSVL